MKTTTSLTTETMTTKAAAVLLKHTINVAWGLISLGNHAYARLDAAPVSIPAVLWRMCRGVVATGEALEAWAERTAERLGIDILDVLTPIADARIG